MAENAVQILLEARESASAVVSRVTRELDKLATAGSALLRLGPAVGAVGAVGTAALAAGVAATVLGVRLSEDVEQLEKLSERTGATTQQLQILKQIMREAGGSGDDLDQALTFLNRAIARQDPLLEQMGIRTKSAFQAFLQLSSIFERSADTGKKASISQVLLGRSSADMLGYVSAIARKFPEMADAARKAGIVLEDDVKPAARHLDEQVDQLRRNWEGAMTRLEVSTVPAATAIVEWLSKASAAVANWWESYQRLNQNLALNLTVALHAPTEDEIKKVATDAANASKRIVDPMSEALGRVTEQASSGLGKLSPKSIQEMKDSLAGVKVGDPEKLVKAIQVPHIPGLESFEMLSEISDDAKRLNDTIAEIMQRMNVSGTEAERMARALQGLDDAEFGRGVTRTLEEMNSQFREALDRADEIQRQSQRARSLEPILIDDKAAPEKKRAARDIINKDTLDSFQRTVRGMLTTSALLRDGLQSVWEGLSRGFSSVFAGLLQKGQTFKTALVTIIKSMGDSILQYLAQLVSASVFKLFLKLAAIAVGAIFGAPEVGAAVGGAAGLYGARRATEEASARPTSVINNYYTTNTELHAIDARSYALDLTSPRGAGRRAGYAIRLGASD